MMILSVFLRLFSYPKVWFWGRENKQVLRNVNIPRPCPLAAEQSLSPYRLHRGLLGCVLAAGVL